MLGSRNGPAAVAVKRRRRRSVVCGFAAAALVALLVGCGVAGSDPAAAGDKAGGRDPAEPVVLAMLNPASNQLSRNFVNEVDELSNGRIRIDITDQWHMDGPGVATRFQDVFDAVRAGEAPLALVGASQFHDQGIRSFDALLAPMLVDRPELETAVLHSDIATDMLSSLDGTGLTGIGILPGPVAHPWGAGRHLLDVADYEGGSFVGPGRPVTQRAIEALGGTYRTPTSLVDLDSASVDGFVVPAVERVGDANGATSVTTNVSFGPFTPVVIGNSDAMAALSDQDRSTLREAARATIDIQIGTDHTVEAQSVGELCRGGEVSFDRASPAQLDALRAKLEPVYQWLREDSATSTFIDRIQQLSGSAPVDPAAASPIDCPDSPDEAAIATPVDGSYSMTTTLDDLKAAGAPPDDWVPERWGESVYIFHHGSFATTQHNDQACTWAFGRFTVDNDVLTLDFADGGGLAPTDRAPRPGQHYGFGWSLYRGELTLWPTEGQPAPIVSGHTWELAQVSATPDVSLLNQRCPPPAWAMPG